VDITTVVILKRYFQRREKTYSIVLQAFLVLNLLASSFWMSYDLSNIATDKDDAQKTKDMNNLYLYRLIIFLSWCSIDIIFFTVTIMLFSFAAYKKHHAAFLDYKFSLFL
jgi:hypothetical protein